MSDEPSHPEQGREWWRTAVIYQVYPRSFQDSDGSGVGDLNGIIHRLDYLSWLGIDAIWLSPIFESPMADFGYDVSDYERIDPLFGSMDDLDRLIDEAHRRGIKVLLDFVPNHTSEWHPWFQESRSSRENPKRDWYIWHDAAADGGPPNNWVSTFGGSAWEWDERTAQYYYHAFLEAQPDLNWRNREVRDAMGQVLRFWLDRGIDGFRVDVIWHLIKDIEFRDNPPNPAYQPGHPERLQWLALYSSDRPEVHEAISELRDILDEYDDRLLIGEVYLPTERLIAYYGEQGRGVHLPFNFQLILLPWKADVIAAAIDEYEQLLPTFAWPNWVLSNHDQPRVAQRVGVDQARVAAMLLLTLRGTPTLYYGDELGMEGIEAPPHLRRDPVGARLPGLGRDAQRTPMQWDASAMAGFSTGDPWLPLEPDHAVRNVEAQQADPKSMLSLYRALITLRRESNALRTGTFSGLNVSGEVLSFERRDEQERCFVALNFSHHDCSIALPRDLVRPQITLSTHLDRTGEHTDTDLHLRPSEGVLLRSE